MTDSNLPVDTQQVEPKKPTRADEWSRHIGEVQDFAQNNQRWPSTTAEDEIERKIAQWWSRQKYYYHKHLEGKKSPGLTAARIKIMESLIGKFGSLERDGVWDTRYHMVKLQLTNHKKLWSYKTEDENEEKVLRWWNQQKTFYRKFRKGEQAGGMNESRALKVEDILRLLGEPIVPRNPNLGAQS